MSSGRSTTTDLPMPSGTKLEPNFEATTFTGGDACGLTAGWPADAKPKLARTIAVKQAGSVAARESVLLGIGAPSSSFGSWRD
jgi:hypothetical protein